MKNYKMVVAALFFIGCALATAGEVETIVAQYHSSKPTVNGFLAKPKGSGPFPAVIVIHEWWGLNEQIRGLAKSLAEEGYVALAVDLYRGTVTKDADVAHELMRGLPEDRALADLKEAFTHLESLSFVKKDKIASIGWCMGGGYSLRLATEEPELAACVVYYGSLVTDPEKIKAIRAPVLAQFGAKDRGITMRDIETFKKSMDRLKKTAQIKIYSKAGHAFANVTGPHYRAQDAADAWKRTLEFFAKHLSR